MRCCLNPGLRLRLVSPTQWLSFTGLPGGFPPALKRRPGRSDMCLGMRPVEWSEWKIASASPSVHRVDVWERLLAGVDLGNRSWIERQECLFPTTNQSQKAPRDAQILNDACVCSVLLCILVVGGVQCWLLTWTGRGEHNVGETGTGELFNHPHQEPSRASKRPHHA